MNPRFMSRPDRWSFVIGLSLVLIVYLPVLLHPDLAFFFRDLTRSEVPIRALTTRAFHELGRLPLWNPNFQLGRPFLADCNARLLSPITWIYFLFPPEASARVTVYVLALQHLLLYLGAFLLFRDMRVRRSLAALGGVALACSGYAMSSDNMSNLLAGQVAMMFLFLFFRRSLRRPVWSLDLMIASLALAAPIYAADPQFAYLGAFGAGLLALRAARPIWDQLARLLLLGSFAVLAAGPQLFPLLGFIPKTARPFQLESDVSQVWSLHPIRLLEAFIPLLFGWSQDNYRAIRFLNGPPGAMPFIFSIYGGGFLFFLMVTWSLCVGGKRGRLVRKLPLFWGTVATVMVLLSMGSYSPIPLHRLFNSLVPGWSTFRFPERLAFWYMFLFSLAGIRCGERLLRLAMRARRLPVGYALAILLFACAGIGVSLHLVRIYPLPVFFSALLFCGLAGLFAVAQKRADVRAVLPLCLLLAGGCDMLYCAQSLVWPSSVEIMGASDKPWIEAMLKDRKAHQADFSAGAAPRFFTLMEDIPKEFSFVPREVGNFDATMRLMWNLLQPNTSGIYGLEDAGGYFTFPMKSYATYMSKLWDVSPKFAVRFASVRYLLLLKGGDPKMVLTDDPMPFAFFPPSVEWLPDVAAVITRVASGKWNPNASVVLEGAGEAGAQGIAKLLRVEKRWDEFELRYRSPPGAWLELNEAFDPQWKAYDERGEILPILRANGFGMAVRTPTGEPGVDGKIVFRYTEPLFAIGLWAFFAWLLALAASAWWARDFSRPKLAAG
jgi:hypothetical protein